MYTMGQQVFVDLGPDHQVAGVVVKIEESASEVRYGVKVNGVGLYGIVASRVYALVKEG